jgi:hypothetical protein
LHFTHAECRAERHSYPIQLVSLGIVLKGNVDRTARHAFPRPDLISYFGSPSCDTAADIAAQGLRGTNRPLLLRLQFEFQPERLRSRYDGRPQVVVQIHGYTPRIQRAIHLRHISMTMAAQQVRASSLIVFLKLRVPTTTSV